MSVVSRCYYSKEKDKLRRGITAEFTSDAHYNLNSFIKLLEQVEVKLREDTLVLPFCSTVEAENLGGKVSFDEWNMPLIRDNKCLDIDQIKSWAYSLDQGRMGLLLNLPKAYSTSSKFVLKVAGPMTVTMGLVPMQKFFKRLRKDSIFKEQFIDEMANNLFKLIHQARQSGYHMVSLADPPGNLDILGGPTFSVMAEIYAKSFTLLSDHDCNMPIYLCPMLMSSLVEYGLINHSATSKYSLNLLSGLCFEQYLKCGQGERAYYLR